MTKQNTKKEREPRHNNFKKKQRSNLDVLTSGAKIYEKKRKFKDSQIEEIKFDEANRREYLTGFQKRNKERKETARANAKKRELIERKEIIREQRLEKIKGIQPMAGLLEEVNMESKKAAAEEKEKNSTLEFADKAATTTVTVVSDILENDDDASISPLSLLKQIQSRSQKLKDEHIPKEESEEESEEESTHHKHHPKKFRYETKNERNKTNRSNSKNSKRSSRPAQKGKK